jgi:hypothetical protein
MDARKYVGHDGVDQPRGSGGETAGPPRGGKGGRMATLTVWEFNSADGADRALERLQLLIEPGELDN